MRTLATTGTNPDAAPRRHRAAFLALVTMWVVALALLDWTASGVALRVLEAPAIFAASVLYVGALVGLAVAYGAALRGRTLRAALAVAMGVAPAVPAFVEAVRALPLEVGPDGELQRQMMMLSLDGTLVTVSYALQLASFALLFLVGAGLVELRAAAGLYWAAPPAGTAGARRVALAVAAVLGYLVAAFSFELSVSHRAALACAFALVAIASARLDAAAGSVARVSNVADRLALSKRASAIGFAAVLAILCLATAAWTRALRPYAHLPDDTYSFARGSLGGSTALLWVDGAWASGMLLVPLRFFVRSSRERGDGGSVRLLVAAVGGLAIALLLLQLGIAGARATAVEHWPKQTEVPAVVTVGAVEVQTAEPGRLTFVPELEIHNLGRSELLLWLATGDAQMNEPTIGPATSSSTRVALPAGKTTSVPVHIDLTASDIGDEGISRECRLAGEVTVLWPGVDTGARLPYSVTVQLTREQAQWLGAGGLPRRPGR